nr:hypothetical protein [Tanacetum cinerariifolium]
MQTQTSNTLHNAIGEAGGKDRPPMLAPDSDIYSTVDACPNACEMWKAIERLKQSELIDVQDLETSLYWEFGNSHQEMVNHFNRITQEWQRFVTLVKQSQELKIISYHKLYDILKQHQNEVNEIRVERIARTANPLALVAQQQPVYHPYNHPTHYTQNSSTKSQQATTRNRGKAIFNSFSPTYDQELIMVTEDDKMSKDKEIDKLTALISLSFKKIYKPTNNNLRTSLNTSRANQDNSPRINRGIELKAHCMYMVQIQEVSLDTAENSGPIFDVEPLHEVQNNDDHYNVFANNEEHPVQPEYVNDTYLEEQGDTNITIDSLDMSANGETVDQDDDDLVNERDLLASLIKKLKYEIDDSKNRNKFLETSNKALVDKLKGEIEDFKTKNKSLESSNNHFKEANNELSKTNQLMFKDLKKFQAELEKHNDVNYMSKAQIANPRLYDIGCYNDNLDLMLAPDSDETIRLAQEPRRMDETIPWDENCKSSKELFKIKSSVDMIFDEVERCKQTITKRTYFGHIDPFIQNTIEGNFCPQIRRINADLEIFHLCLKEEMVADLRYFNSLEHEVDSLKSQLETQKTQVLNKIDRLSREYYYADHMNALLGVYTTLDEFTDLQCDYLKQVVECERLKKEISKSKTMSKNFEALHKHAINLELALQQWPNHNLFFVGQFCDVDLEVAFRKSTCYIHDLKGNDLLIVLIDLNKLVQRGLHAQVRTVQTDKGKEFLNKTLHEYFAQEGIQHQTSVARTPEQNGIVERWIRTLVEAVRTMLSAAKVPLYFCAEGIATTCYTQNRSLVIPRHEKTHYHIINGRKPFVKFFYIFGSLCYIVKDGENLDKIKEKVVSKTFAVNANDAPDKRQQQNITQSATTTVVADIPPLNIQTAHVTTNQAPTQARMYSPWIATRGGSFGVDKTKVDKVAWIAWDNALLPRTNGGLGICSLKAHKPKFSTSTQLYALSISVLEGSHLITIRV